MRVNIAATKTNLLKVKKDLALTKEGYELLDEKRKILLTELAGLIDKTVKAENDLDEALRSAYAELNKQIVAAGRRQLEEVALAVGTETHLSLSSRRIMGVTLPVLGLKINDRPPYNSSLFIGVGVDEVRQKFQRILPLLAKVAELKITTLRLGKEVQKTIRKVNALEKVYIPYYKEAAKSIGDRLDEESRDAFSMLKLIKQKR